MRLTGPPPGETGRPEPAPLPARAEVVVVGVGAGGIGAARALASAGVDVVVVGPEEGWMAGGLHGRPDEPLVQLVEALGEPRARALCDLLAEGRDALLQAGAARATGGLELAAMPGEDALVRGAAERLEGWGVACRLLEDAGEAGGPPGWGPALHVPGDATALPNAVEVLLRDAADAGVRWCGGAAAAIQQGPTIRLEDGRSVDAELVLVAAGARTGELVPDLGDTIVPFRVQAMAWPGRPGPAIRGQRGHVLGWSRPDGLQVLAGCRWASPHLEVGERDPGTAHPAVTRALAGLKDRLWPGAGEVRWHWAAIAAGSCDGLPVVGPVPGRARLGVLAGLGTRSLELGAALGPRVARALLDGNADLPPWMAPGRFV